MRRPAGDFARDASIAVRRLAAGLRAHRPAGFQLPGTSRGESRSARPAPAVRALHVLDGEARAGEFARAQLRSSKNRRKADVPKRTDLDSILIIGAGPIIIGQACEFDYSGAQACKALKEEGYRVILVNSNPATIMTDPGDRGRHLYRADQLAHHRANHREGAAHRAAADHGRPDGAQLPRSTWCAKGCWRNSTSR